MYSSVAVAITECREAIERINSVIRKRPDAEIGDLLRVIPSAYYALQDCEGNLEMESGVTTDTIQLEIEIASLRNVLTVAREVIAIYSGGDICSMLTDVEYWQA